MSFSPMLNQLYFYCTSCKWQGEVGLISDAFKPEEKPGKLSCPRCGLGVLEIRKERTAKFDLYQLLQKVVFKSGKKDS